MQQTLAEDWTLGVFTRTIHRGKVALWSWDPEARTARFDELAQRFWGDLPTAEQRLDALFERIDPRDRDEAVRLWLASAESGSPYEFDFRIPQGGSHRWVSARGVGGDDGQLNGKVLAVFVDVTAQREAQEALETLVSEMGHRIANLFSVASAMVGMVARDAENKDVLVIDLQSRFAELRSAFTYAIRRSERGLGPVPLSEVIGELTTAYRRGEDRVKVHLPDGVMVSGERITDIALVIHELATNSVKYGALGAESGTVSVEGEQDGDTLRVTWREEGPKPVHDVPAPTGFGSRMVDHTVEASLGGKIERWVDNGQLTVHLTLDLDGLRG